ncbi:PREDICTED: sulfite exporter TauE/SafE family [Prunus dulcis]|uniref:PREDICTED: sulfite exporter TauE/SafE family n=1 Tax=Prunus dulcis TaxID=3755 RepID=A0A5E4ETP2_PRUDU|nr:PREDICTED: sulfite exporter TauE/SafE family [Prunus dulcis]
MAEMRLGEEGGGDGMMFADMRLGEGDSGDGMMLADMIGRADGSGEDYKLLPSGPVSLPDEQVPISHNDDNVYWKELLMLVNVWVAFLIVQLLSCGIVAGMVASLLGLGGGFILGPLFLELGIPP